MNVEQPNHVDKDVTTLKEILCVHVMMDTGWTIMD